MSLGELDPLTELWLVDGATDPSRFDAGRLGPYLLGPCLRRHRFGEVLLALDEPQRRVIEIDCYDRLSGTPLAGPDGKLLADIALVMGLAHRHIAPIIASGVGDGVPYTVRQHRLGRALGEVWSDGVRIGEAAAAGILHAVADALAFLAAEGPRPGACAMGGFDDADVFLGFDGDVRLTGLGARRARIGDADPLSADLAACFELARRLDRGSGGGLVSTTAASTTTAEVATAVRKRHGEACGARRRWVAGALRDRYASEIHEERARCGLGTLQ